METPAAGWAGSQQRVKSLVKHTYTHKHSRLLFLSALTIYICSSITASLLLETESFLSIPGNSWRVRIAFLVSSWHHCIIAMGNWRGSGIERTIGGEVRRACGVCASAEKGVDHFLCSLLLPLAYGKKKSHPRLDFYSVYYSWLNCKSDHSSVFSWDLDLLYSP